MFFLMLLLLLLLLFLAHQHKAAGVKTKQNVKQRLQRLLIRCSLCWGRRPHSLLQSYGQALKQKDFLWCPGWWLWCVCQSPGLAQQPCHPMCLLLLLLLSKVHNSKDKNSKDKQIKMKSSPRPSHGLSLMTVVIFYIFIMKIMQRTAQTHSLTHTQCVNVNVSLMLVFINYTLQVLISVS